MQHAEDLARGAAARDALAPAVQADVQGALPAELEERERRAVAPRRLEDQVRLEHARLGMKVPGESAASVAGAADDGARGGGDGGRAAPSSEAASSGATRSTMSCT